MVTFASPTEAGPRLPAGEYIMRLKDIEEAEPSTFNPETQRLKFVLTVLSVESIDLYPAISTRSISIAMTTRGTKRLRSPLRPRCPARTTGSGSTTRWAATQPCVPG
jgi:hypothetical protein